MILLLATMGILVQSASSLSCYQCVSNIDMECADMLIHDADNPFVSTSCQNVYDAQYCVKIEGMYEGNLGTKRFCSSLDLGNNYCTYLDSSIDGADVLIKACVYSCTTDGCNHSSNITPKMAPVLAAIFFAYFFT